MTFNIHTSNNNECDGELKWWKYQYRVRRITTDKYIDEQEDYFLPASEVSYRVRNDMGRAFHVVVSL